MVGIQNSRASCYAISVIQVLAHIPTLNIIAGALGEVFRAIRTTEFDWLASHYADNVILESNLVLLDGSIPTEQWEIGTQEDPGEFFLRLARRYHAIREMCQFNIKSYWLDEHDERHKRVSEHLLFEMIIEGNQLVFPRFTGQELSQDFIINPALIMVLNIPRTRWEGEERRDDTPIDLPDEYNLTDSFYPPRRPNLPGPLIYQLFAFIMHINDFDATDAKHGHYITYMVIPPVGYIKFNDSQVAEVSVLEFALNRAHAYLAFYCWQHAIHIVFPVP
jgi:hypothetical protein